MKTFLRILWKSPTVLLLVALVLVLATEFSLIYDFRQPEPFTGPDIFNPYSALDTAQCWKKSVFHTSYSLLFTSYFNLQSTYYILSLIFSLFFKAKNHKKSIR